ncbi:DNA-formamidopyrimidine glycosylase [Sulfoacidibacillus thermotolerans]|uniref:Formamidopyrimidine-DNA glycosylase n=1 Tax=Sulfoacidibacillus thermotolerans TaxID=1765684 RepID=A0A2U3D9T3_SULT2|nr:DNA-formamidopyrimidine glycosylase [Sulfoacidibacillus thermotolerans]PWI58047.1 DNA-formamidopyrimidine glycosylase [Sulfoacidibacillus thermotolerans]
MPELPEVETVRRGLQSLVAGRKIMRAEVRLPRIVRTPSVDEFTQELLGVTIHEVRRRGKYLLFDLGAQTLITHLRMEGRYGLYRAEEAQLPHTHVIFHLDQGQELRYQDVRQFGTMDLIPSFALEKFSPLLQLGPEPFDKRLTAKYLQAIFQHRKTSVKAVLLDQRVIAGLGNIYVDEILFRARIHPAEYAQDLSLHAARRIVVAMREILRQAIAHGGSSVRSYVNGFGEEGQYQLALHVYGRTAQPCTVCGAPIVKLRVAGRGTHVCTKCQRPPYSCTKSKMRL